MFEGKNITINSFYYVTANYIYFKIVQLFIISNVQTLELYNN